MAGGAGKAVCGEPSFDVGMASLLSLGGHLLVHSRDIEAQDTSRSTLIEIRWSQWKGALSCVYVIQIHAHSCTSRRIDALCLRALRAGSLMI